MTPITAAQAVALEFGVLLSDLLGSARGRTNSDARKALAYVMREECKPQPSWAAVAGVMGCCRPTAILRYNRAKDHIKTCQIFRNSMNNILDRIQQAA